MQEVDVIMNIVNESDSGTNLENTNARVALGVHDLLPELTDFLQLVGQEMAREWYEHQMAENANNLDVRSTL